MYPADGIRSQLEWTSTLSTTNAPQPTEKTKFLRKVRDRCSKMKISPLTTTRPQSSLQSVGVLTFVTSHWYLFLFLLGPNTNTVEKLAALRRAGVNVGEWQTDFSGLISQRNVSLVRMNFSHGSYEYHQSVIDNTRKAVAREYLFSTMTYLLNLHNRGPQWSPCGYRPRHCARSFPSPKTLLTPKFL